MSEKILGLPLWVVLVALILAFVWPGFVKKVV